MTEPDHGPAPNTGDEFVVVGELLPEKALIAPMLGDAAGRFGVSRERIRATRARAAIPARCDNANVALIKHFPALGVLDSDGT